MFRSGQCRSCPSITGAGLSAWRHGGRQWLKPPVRNDARAFTQRRGQPTVKDKDCNAGSLFWEASRAERIRDKTWDEALNPDSDCYRLGFATEYCTVSRED